MLNDMFHQLVEDIDQIMDDYSGDKFLQTIGQRYALSHVAYLGLNLPQKEDEVYIQTTYSDKWCKRYITENYVAIDPVVGDGFKGILPLDWGVVRDSNEKVKNFFGESSEFGVGRQGLSFPIRGAKGETALFSINSHVDDREWAKLKKEFMRDFQLIAYHFHTRTLENESKLITTKNHLTPRETECMKWAAAGKTAWETGMILGIKESTVAFFIEQVRVKLGAVNKTQAVAKAIRLRLI